MELPKAIHELEYGHGSVYGPEEEAALDEVLRAGAPSCGPQGKEIRRDVSPAIAVREYGLRGYVRHGRAATGGDRGRVWTGRRGDHDSDQLDLDRQRRRGLGRASRLRRRRSADVESGSRFGAREDHAAHQGDSRRASLRSMLRHGPDHGAGARRATFWSSKIAPTPPAPSTRAAGAGSLGDIGVFSFHQQKNMVTLGEGGMITTSRGRSLRAHALVPLSLLPDLRSQGQVSAARRNQASHGQALLVSRFRRNRLQLSHDRCAGRRGLWCSSQSWRLQCAPHRRSPIAYCERLRGIRGPDHRLMSRRT